VQGWLRAWVIITAPENELLRMRLKNLLVGAFALVAATDAFLARAREAAKPPLRACAVTYPEGGVYGNDSLAVVLPENGTFVFRPGGPGFVDADGALGIKVGWEFRKRGTLVVKGRRLDGVAEPARAYIPLTYNDSIGGMSLFLVFPTPGCWEITGSLAGADLTFIVEVQKIGAGPASHMRGPPSGSRVTSG
jgi:hypothetical protein